MPGSHGEQYRERCRAKAERSVMALMENKRSFGDAAVDGFDTTAVRI